MKTNISNSVSRQAVLALSACMFMGFTACSSDDPSVDELLSDKTTPVTFELRKGTHFMYDYAGSHYVGGDTIRVSKNGEVKRDLRQGQHSILWLNDPYYDEGNLYGMHFDADRKMLIRNGEYPDLNHSIWYAVSEVNVSEYLLPTQTLTYSTPMSAIFLYVEDADRYPGAVDKEFLQIGVLKGYPNVVSVSLTGNEYERRESVDLPIYYYPKSKNMQIIGADGSVFMCPKEGLDNIQLVIEIKDQNGTVISTSELPKMSFRRGKSISLQGTLFSGKSSDWKEIPNQ